MRPTIWTRGGIKAGAGIIASETSDSDFTINGNLDITGTISVEEDVSVTGGLTVNGTATVDYLELEGTGTNIMLKGNSQTIVVANPLTAKPSAARGVAFTVVSNSTGVGLAVNVTGTTWKWLATTAIQPT